MDRKSLYSSNNLKIASSVVNKVDISNINRKYIEDISRVQKQFNSINKYYESLQQIISSSTHPVIEAISSFKYEMSPCLGINNNLSKMVCESLSGVKQFSSISQGIEAIGNLGVKGGRNSFWGISKTLNEFMPKFTFQSEFIEFSNVNSNLGSIFKTILDAFDINKIALDRAEIIVSENKDLINIFLSNNIFPPIFFLESNISSIREFKDIDQIIENEEVKKFYKEEFKYWNKHIYPKHIKIFIKELYNNFNSGHIYTTTIALFTLLEYRIRRTELKIVKQDGKVLIFRTYKETIKDSVFYRENIKNSVVKFLKDIFKNTDKAKSLTRHVVHGEKIELINYRGMMSILFFYDFIDKILKIEKI